MDSFFILLVLGFVVGIISSFLGVGGGFVLLPCLYWLYPMAPPQVIISSSLSVIFLNSLLNIGHFINTGLRPSKDLSYYLLCLMSLGAFVGGYFSFSLSTFYLKLILALLLFYNGSIVLFCRTKKTPRILRECSRRRKGTFFSFILLIGALAGLTGIGGGVLMIPLLIWGLRVPYTQLSLYSNIAMLGSSFTSSITYVLIKGHEGPFSSAVLNAFQLGQVNGLIVFCIFIGALCTRSLGIWLKGKTQEGLDRAILSTLLFCLSARIFWDILL